MRNEVVHLPEYPRLLERYPRGGVVRPCPLPRGFQFLFSDENSSRLEILAFL